MSPRRYFGPPARRHYAYAHCSSEEYAAVQTMAKREGLSISDFVRRCINSYLVEVEADDLPLLAERRTKDRVTN